MKPSSIARLIFDTIPQLYEAKTGRHPVELTVPGEGPSRIFSLLPLSADLERYMQGALETWEEIRPITEGEITQTIEREWIQQKFAVHWLEMKTGIQTWNLLLDYCRRLSRRTTENQVLSKTVVIEPSLAPDGAPTLTDENYHKVFDWLGSTSLTHYVTDDHLQIKSLEAISLTSIADLQEYRFYPDFLHPVISSLKNPASVVIHMTSNGSFLVANRDGLLASKRKGESWTIFDIDHVIASVAELIRRQIGSLRSDPGCVACSLFQILFDISMKRQGGLIVLDHPENLASYVVSGIERTDDSPLNAIFTHSPFNGLEYSIPEVRKLVELSSIDGALILDMQGNLVQVGSMIIAHPTTANRFGTREAAAYSAAKHGATAFKVSSDGHVSIFFSTPDISGDEVHRFDFR